MSTLIKDLTGPENSIGHRAMIHSYYGGQKRKQSLQLSQARHEADGTTTGVVKLTKEQVRAAVTAMQLWLDECGG